MRFSFSASALGAASLLGIVLLAKLFGEGGVDTNTYQQIIYSSPAEWGSYYLGNVFAWSIIYTSFKLTEGYPIGFSLAVIDIIIWMSYFIFSKRDKNFNTNGALLALLSISGILLSYNVLRQYIAIVFVLICSIRFLQARGARAWPFVILALLSHFSAIIFLAALLFSRYNFKRKIVRVLLLPLIYLGCTALFVNFRPSAVASAESIGDSTAELYAFFLLALVLFALFSLKIRVCSAGRSRPIAIQEASRFLFYSLAIILAISAAGPPVWFINRFLISFIFLTSSFTFMIISKGGTKYGNLLGLGINFATISLLIVTVLFHPGAMDMI